MQDSYFLVPGGPRLPWEVVIALLLLRSVLLWLVIPAGIAAWLAYFAWAKRVSLGLCLGWFDLNLGAFLLVVVLKHFVSNPPLAWVPSSRMASGTYRYRILG
jgi:hypothetical protein